MNSNPFLFRLGDDADGADGSIADQSHGSEAEEDYEVLNFQRKAGIAGDEYCTAETQVSSGVSNEGGMDARDT